MTISSWLLTKIITTLLLLWIIFPRLISPRLLLHVVIISTYLLLIMHTLLLIIPPCLLFISPMLTTPRALLLTIPWLLCSK